MIVNEQQSLTKSRFFAKPIIIAIAIASGLAVLFFGYLGYVYAFPRSHVDFAYFTPAGYDITDEKIILAGRSHTFFDPLNARSAIPRETQITYKMLDEKLFVGEKKNGNFSYQCGVATYDGDCRIWHTAGGQKYVGIYTETVKDETVAKMDGVDFMTNGTLISITNTSKGFALSNEQWGRIIDSFEKSSFSKLPYEFRQSWV